MTPMTFMQLLQREVAGPALRYSLPCLLQAQAAGLGPVLQPIPQLSHLPQARRRWWKVHRAIGHAPRRQAYANAPGNRNTDYFFDQEIERRLIGGRLRLVAVAITAVYGGDQFGHETGDTGNYSVPSGFQSAEQQAVVADEQGEAGVLARQGQRPKVGGVSTAVLHSNQIRHAVEQTDSGGDFDPIRKRGKVIEQAWHGDRGAHRLTVRDEVILFVAKEERHRHQQRIATGACRALSQ